MEMAKTAALPGVEELHRDPRPLFRAGLIVAAYLVAFIILDRFAQQFEEIRGVVAWYPPAGLTYAILLVFGVRFAPAVTIALLFGSLFIYRMPQPFYALLLWAIIISLIYGATAAFLRHRVRFDWRLPRLRDVTYLVATATFVSALLAVLSVSSSALSSDMPRSEVLGAIFDWWVGETVGVLTVAPFLLIYVMPGLKAYLDGQPVRLPTRWSLPRPTLAVIGQAAILAFSLYWVFGVRVMDEIQPLYLLTLPLIWIALAHGFKGVTAAIISLNFGVVLAQLFFRLDLAHLGELQLLMMVNCIVGLLMGAVVTDRKQAEGVLRESENRLRTIVEGTRALLMSVDADGYFTYANDATARAVGYARPEELIGKSYLHFIHPEDRQQVLNTLVKQVNARQPSSIQEFRVIDTEGSVKWFSFLSTLAVRDGQLAGQSGVAQDITERKRAQEQIQRQLQRLAALREIDLAITGSMDLQVTLKVILEQVIAQLGVDAADVLLLNPNSHTLEYYAGRGFRTDALRHTRLRLGDGLAGRAALERRVVHVANLSQEKDGLVRAPRLDSEGFVTYHAVPLIAKGKVEGVLELFHRAPFAPDDDWLDFAEALAGQAAITLDNAQLFADLQRSNLDLTLAYDATLEGWSRALDLRDKETEGHSQRVTEMAVCLASLLKVPESALVHVRRGALLHDIGKLGVPDQILLKPGKLTEDEWVIMRGHPLLAYDLLSPITYLNPALDIPYCHHERWDGTGYPRQLKGEAIPLAARIFAVVDVWDALGSDRPYRKAWPREKIVAYMRQQSGADFDPRILNVFLSMEVEDEEGQT